jgi:hypothetical protein
VHYQIHDISGIRVSVCAVRATHHSLGERETLVLWVSVSASQSISMQLVGPVDEILVNEVRFIMKIV